MYFWYQSKGPGSLVYRLSQYHDSPYACVPVVIASISSDLSFLLPNLFLKMVTCFFIHIKQKETSNIHTRGLHCRRLLSTSHVLKDSCYISWPKFITE